MARLYQGRIATPAVTATILVEIQGTQDADAVKLAMADAVGDAIGDVEIVNSWDLGGVGPPPGPMGGGE